MCVYIYTYIYIYIYIHIYRDTISSLPILYGVCHANGMSGGGGILPNRRATVVHPSGQCRLARRMKGWLIRAKKASK